MILLGAAIVIARAVAVGRVVVVIYVWSVGHVGADRRSPMHACERWPMAKDMAGKDCLRKIWREKILTLTMHA